MDMKAFHRWADTVNAILRKRDDKKYEPTRRTLLTRSHMLPESNSGESFLTLARDVVELIAAGYNVPSVLERAILAYEVARRDQHWDDYASASVVVAYCLVRMDMAPRALEMIGEVWDTVLRIDDADTVALGEMIMAKIRMEEAFKLDEADYREWYQRKKLTSAVIEGEIVKARDLAERARWSRLYDEGEQALSAIAKKQGRERTVASLPKYDNISDIWRVAILVGRKVIGMDP
jgi:uncharacterized membrane protein YkvA (DUF1232 family)